jgi:hypothetical protein
MAATIATFDIGMPVFLHDRRELFPIFGNPRQTIGDARIERDDHERLGRNVPSARQPVVPCRLEPEPRVEAGVPDDDDERTPGGSQALEALLDEPTADALPLT